MSKYTAEQVAREADLQEDHVADMLRDYAAILRERESAKAAVTDELAERVLNRYVNECISHLDEAPVHLRVTAMRVALEAVAPMLAKPKSDPVAWRYRLDGDMQWQHTSDKRICVGEIEPLYNAMSVASVRVPDGWQLVPIDPTDEMIEKGTDQHECMQGDPWYADTPLSENDCIAIYKAMLAAALKPETEE